ncbi:PAS domain S-box protein, partial [Candidatus Latescibacterota bacterium]
LKLPFLMTREIPKLLLHFKNRLMGKDVGTYELHFVKRSGEILLGEINASMIEFEDGTKADLVVIRDITERRKLTDEIRQSRDYFINLVNSTMDMIIAVDAKRNIVLFNKAAESAFGYTEEEVLGKHINILYANNVQGLLIHKQLNKGGGFSGEILNMRKNSEIFTSYISSNTLYDESKNIIGYLGVSRDITERKNAEQEKEKLLFDFGERVKELNCLYGLAKIADQPEMTLEDILDNVVYLLPLTCQYQEITCARIKVYGVEKKTANYEETEWKMSADIKIHNDKIGEVHVFYTEERPNLYEGPFLEEERHLLDTVADQVGKIVDHSQHEKERRKLINSLTDKTSELNTILDSVGDAIITTDEKYIITSVNRAFCDMFGCGSHDYIGKSCEDLFKCDGEPETESCKDHCGLQNTLDNMASISSRMTITLGEGKTIVVQSINSPLVNSEGKVIGAVKSMRDISKEAEVERMKNEFVSTVSHELRTPLTSIKGYVDLFLDGDTGEINEIQKEFLDIVSQNTDRLTALINDLLDVEKIDAGKISLDKQNVGFEKLVELAFRTMEPLANENNLEYTISIEDDVKIYADRDRIMQVLTNLLSNAIKFTKKGSVSISLKKDNSKAVLIVKDTGIGVRKADRKKLFTKFFRAKEAYKKNIAGTGLGLSIVKSIVELHDGEISLESTLHKGSEVKVEFPLAKKAEKII